MRTTVRTLCTLALLAPSLLAAQGRGGGRGGGRQIQPAPGSTPIPADSQPAYVRKAPPTDPVIQRMWDEGMQRSQAEDLAQVLTDSLGPRLTGSPDMERASAWVQSMYKKWGIPARAERYGTWSAYRKGWAHVDLVAPRSRTLEASLLSWSPGTGGRAIEADVITLPDSGAPAAVDAWLRSARGKIVLASAPQLSCRAADQWAEFGTPASRERLRARQDSINRVWQGRNRAAITGGVAENVTAPGGGGNLQDRLQAAGVAAVITSNFSVYPGTSKIFGTTRQKLPTLDVTCEDYGLLARLAEKKQGPRVRLAGDAEILGERPVFNTIAEIKGSQLPNEYVVLSAHFDTWGGSSGATDNTTGTVVMMEAARILKTVLPNPKRTIVVGHWSGEEQGLNGSRAFSEDHPEIVQGMQALFNQDNGTGRITSMGPGALPGTAAVLQRYLGEIPSDLTQYIRFGRPSAPANGGSDNASFACHGAPAFGLGALGWDYSNTTWHTNRDTFDKIVVEDLKGNATLTAMLAYLASEDPQKMPRDRLDPLPNNPQTGQPMQWPACTKALRSSVEYRR